MKQVICICCPKGCHLEVDDENGYSVTGNACERGADYGKMELVAPTRVITSTVKIKGAAYPRCPVKTAEPIPKALMNDIMRALDSVTLTAPVKVGDVALPNVCDTGVAVVVTRDLPSV